MNEEQKYEYQKGYMFAGYHPEEGWEKVDPTDSPLADFIQGFKDKVEGKDPVVPEEEWKEVNLGGCPFI